MVNEKTVKFNNLLGRMQDTEKTSLPEVHKLFEEGLSLSTEKDATKKLISALIERCIAASIEQDGWLQFSYLMLSVLFLVQANLLLSSSAPSQAKQPNTIDLIRNRSIRTPRITLNCLRNRILSWKSFIAL